MIKLHITDQGDPSAGISPRTYTVDSPFDEQHCDAEEMDWFREQMENIYKGFAEGRLTSNYETGADEPVFNL